MLGVFFTLYFPDEEKPFLAWEASVSGIDWLMQLEKEQHCKLIENNHFYPNIYQVEVKDCLPLLIELAEKELLATITVAQGKGKTPLILDECEPFIAKKAKEISQRIMPDTVLKIQVWDLS